MPVVFPVNASPAGFGIVQDDDRLEIISPCCSSPIQYTFKSPEGTDTGSPKGRAQVICEGCGKTYRGYSNPSRLVRDIPGGIAKHWIEPWLGLTDVEVTISNC